MTNIERLQTTGILRIGSLEPGFRYQSTQGARVSRDDLARIEALKIPPAWKDVAISAAPSARLQAVGQDAAGRWQYIYHQNHVRHREKNKLKRLIQFADSLPTMRRTVAGHLRLSGLPRERVMACILRILSLSFIRPGSEIYANENGSYGIATLRPKHVTIKGDTIIFDFPGKSGKQSHSELRDRSIARVVRQLLCHPARDVFKYQDEEGKFIDIKRRHINAYIREVTGRNFSAKDFRTWAGTLICACALARAAADVDGKQSGAKRRLVAAIKETAEALGNTPAVCRDAYICPLVMSCFEKGRVIDRYFKSVQDLITYRGTTLHPAEKSLLKLLQKESLNYLR